MHGRYRDRAALVYVVPCTSAELIRQFCLVDLLLLKHIQHADTLLLPGMCTAHLFHVGGPFTGLFP